MKGLYREFLRVPNFKGKSRIDRAIKNAFFQPRPFTINNGLSMWLDPMEWAQAEIIGFGVIEPLTNALIRRLLRPGDVYVDVGAHVGFHTLTARGCLGASGRVVAIEPQPYNCERILQNWHVNGFENIDLIVAAAGAKEGTVQLRQQAGTDKSRLSLTLPGVNDQPQRFHVPIVTVDEVLLRLDIGRVAVIKVDVEGYESHVISGMEAALDCTANLIFEQLPSDRGTSDAALIANALHRKGFQLRTVTGEKYDRTEPLPENNVWASRA